MGPEVMAFLQAASPYLVAGGTAASMIGERQAQKERNKIIGRSMQRTDETQDKAQAAIQEEAAMFAPDQRQKAIEAEEAAAYERAMQDTGGATIDTTAKGNVSDAYTQARADKESSEGERTSAIARELAKVRAPGQQLQTEGIRRADLSGKLGSMWTGARGQSNAAMLQAQGVEAPGYADLGKLASAIGMAGGMMAPASATSTATGPGMGAWTAADGASEFSWFPQRQAAASRLTAVPRVRFGA